MTRGCHNYTSLCRRFLGGGPRLVKASFYDKSSGCKQFHQNSLAPSVVMFYPCLFCPCDNGWRSRHADAPRSAHFSTVISPSWITQQISVEKCMHCCMSAPWEHQTMFKIVTWTKQTWTKHHQNGSLLQKNLRICLFS